MDGPVRVIIQFYTRNGDMVTRLPDEFTFPNRQSWLDYLAILTRHTIQCTILYRSDDDTTNVV